MFPYRLQRLYSSVKFFQFGIFDRYCFLSRSVSFGFSLQGHLKFGSFCRSHLRQHCKSIDELFDGSFKYAWIVDFKSPFHAKLTIVMGIAVILLVGFILTKLFNRKEKFEPSNFALKSENVNQEV